MLLVLRSISSRSYPILYVNDIHYLTKSLKGNHDTTLDPPFFHSNANKWKWPAPQDPEACRKLITEASSITYLEHEAADIYLRKTQTCLRIFGSPYSPGRRGWAFQYWGDEEAQRLWGHKGMEGADVVVTHTPAYGYVDAAVGGDRAGCEVLAKRLRETRPMLHVSGHIHHGRGVQRVRWDGDSSPVEVWTDPGQGSKKMSLVDLTGRTGRKVENQGRRTRHVVPESLEGQPGEEANSTSSLVASALSEAEVGMWKWRRKAGGAMECRRRSEVDADESTAADGEALGNREDRSETVMINAAFLGPRTEGKASTFHKPIVVDVELPVWAFDSCE